MKVTQEEILKAAKQLNEKTASAPDDYSEEAVAAIEELVVYAANGGGSFIASNIPGVLIGLVLGIQIGENRG